MNPRPHFSLSHSLTYAYETDGFGPEADCLRGLPCGADGEALDQELVDDVVGEGDPGDHEQPGHHVEDPALGAGEVVVEVGGQPGEQDEEAVVLTKVAHDAGPRKDEDDVDTTPL